MTHMSWLILSTGTARRAFVMKADTPATSNVEAALDQVAQEYIALLIGLINAPEKPRKAGESKDAGKGDEIDELALDMEHPSAGMLGFAFAICPRKTLSIHYQLFLQGVAVVHCRGDSLYGMISTQAFLSCCHRALAADRSQDPLSRRHPSCASVQLCPAVQTGNKKHSRWFYR